MAHNVLTAAPGGTRSGSRRGDGRSLRWLLSRSCDVGRGGGRGAFGGLRGAFRGAFGRRRSGLRGPRRGVSLGLLRRRHTSGARAAGVVYAPDMTRLLLPTSLLVALFLALPAAAQSEDGVIKLAAPGFSGVNVSDKEAVFFNEYFAEKLSARGGLKITTASEVQAVLGLERQKQLLGCEEDTSCLIEIAGALGVDGIVLGSVARFGDSYGVNLKIIDAKNSEKWAGVSGQVEAQKGVLTFLEDAAIRMAKDVKRNATAETPDASSASSSNAVAATSAPASPSNRFPETSEERAQMIADEARAKAVRQAAARSLIRIDVPIIGGGYEYRVLDFLRVGVRARLLSFLGAHSSGAVASGADMMALVRYEPFMDKPFGFSLHAGLGGGSYAWVGDFNNIDDVDGQASLSFSAGGEVILGQIWRIGVDLTALPGGFDPGGVITTVTFGRAWLF